MFCIVGFLLSNETSNEQCVPSSPASAPFPRQEKQRGRDNFSRHHNLISPHFISWVWQLKASSASLPREKRSGTGIVLQLSLLDDKPWREYIPLKLGDLASHFSSIIFRLLFLPWERVLQYSPFNSSNKAPHTFAPLR